MRCLYDSFLLEMRGRATLENGIICISDLKIPVERILGQEDEENFQYLFDGWIQIKREIANDIIKNEEQKHAFRELTKAYSNNRVMPFIGAGLSIPSGYPGWTDFLRTESNFPSVNKKKFKALLNQGLYEDAAELLSTSRGPGFDSAIKRTFDQNLQIKGPVVLLPEIFSCSVLTTNFDNILEQCFSSAGNDFESVVIGLLSESLRADMAKKRLLLKLHGHAEYKKGRILTKSEYDACYDGGSPLIKAVQHLCNSTTLLFIGCSLVKDRMLSIMKEYIAQEKGCNLPDHYAFMQTPSTERERKKRQDELAHYNIYPIWYPQEAQGPNANPHDEAIEALLIKLHEDVQS